MQYQVVNPFTGESGKVYEQAGAEQIETATETAWQRWKAASAESIAERAARISTLADLHEQRKSELADIIIKEMGKPKSQALGEVEFSAGIYRYYAENAQTFLADQEIPAENGRAYLRKTSIGPLLGIMPWNFPYYQVARFAGPNLILGNTILLKHAPQCPESALALESMFHEAGMGEGAYTNLFLSNEQVAELIGDRRVRGVSLTGSERAGAAVAEVAGRHLKKVVLELGGSDPFIVLGTDDLDNLVEQAVAARLDNSGQACNAAKRFIVIDSLYDEFASKLTERLAKVVPTDPHEDPELGPLSSVAAAQRLEEQISSAISEGAQVLLRGDAPEGAKIAPTVLAGISAQQRAFGEEFFGPVAQLYKVASEDEAIEIANATQFGLGSYVFTPDEEQAKRVADRIEAGMVFINQVGAESWELPFGGVKRSGTGRELGAVGIQEFMNVKMVHLP